MRFGAFIPQGWRLDLQGVPVEEHWPTMLRIAGGLEAAGYESAWVYDHFHTVPVPTQEPVYEAWTLMAALAVKTERLRLGQMCTSNSYRMPSYLAKVAANIDVLSGGRLEVGIGAGWYEHEYRGYGYPFPEPAVRIRQLREGVEILRAMWTEDVVVYDGKHYQLDGAICRPKPMQDPHPPLWIAGGGEQLTLRVVARYADYANFAGTLDNFLHKKQVLEEHCAAVGRDPSEITLSSNFDVIIGETETDVEAKLDWLADTFAAYRDTDPAEYRERYRRSALVGTPDELVERLRRRAEHGLEVAILYFPDAAYDPSSYELFAGDVATALP
jgi:F420-dependent oxidoreductase-like protein